MNFHLNFNPSVSDKKITHQHQLLFIGSCFSQHISHKLKELKFSVNTNPFGITFNPISIAECIERIINLDYFTENDILKKEDVYFCLQAHSNLNTLNKTELLENLNNSITNWHKYLKTANYLCITFGSAYAYQNIKDTKIVANCHKLPAQLFKKVLIEPQHIIDEYGLVIKELQKYNPNLNILFTVSPVKHLKDGITENSLSKAILIQSVHKLITLYPTCSYFAAYELVNDDLRDYRFYEADMAHPNKQAVEYVWNKFSDVYFSKETKQLNEKINDIVKAKEHKPFKESSETFIKLKQEYYTKCLSIVNLHPYINLQTELNYFDKKLNE